VPTLGTQLLVLGVLLLIGFIGVAIVRGVPAGSMFLGVLIFVFGFALIFFGFGSAIIVGFSMLTQLFAAN
jgi:hypothetical protein